MPGVISRGVPRPYNTRRRRHSQARGGLREKAMAEDRFQLSERDVIAVTESVVARADGN